MKLPRVRSSVRRMMIAVAVVGLSLFGWDAMRFYSLASKYRRKAEAAARMEQKLREIDAIDPVLRARKAKEAEEQYQEISHALLDDPVWTRSLIRYFAAMRIKYEHAADNPSLPLPPDPPQP
jgi:hypothetical protein